MPTALSTDLVAAVRFRCCMPLTGAVSDADIYTWLTEAQEVLASAEAPEWLIRPLCRYATRSLVPGQSQQPLPPDFLRERFLRYVGMPGHRIELAAARSATQNALLQPNAEQVLYSVFNDNLHLYGYTPEAGHVLHLWYVARPLRQRAVSMLYSDGTCIVANHGLTADHVGIEVAIDQMEPSSGEPNGRWVVAAIPSSMALQLTGRSGTGVGGKMFFYGVPQVAATELPILGVETYPLLLMWAASRLFEAIGEPENAAAERGRFYAILAACRSRVGSGRPTDRRTGEPPREAPSENAAR